MSIAHRFSFALPLALVGTLIFHSNSFATMLPIDFAGPSLDPGLIESGSLGTGYTVNNGTLVLSQEAGRGNGEVTVSALAPVTGDFVLSVNAFTSKLGRADLGIVLGNVDWTYSIADIFVNGSGHSINGNIFQPKFNGAFLLNAASTVTLTMTRTGDKISDIFNAGSGPIVVNSRSDPLLAGPVTLSLFLLEAVGDVGPHQGSFSDLGVVSSQGSTGGSPTVGEPPTTGMFVLSILALFGVRQFRHSHLRHRHRLMSG